MTIITMAPTIIAIEGIDGAGKNTLAQALSHTIGVPTISFPQYGKNIYADTAARHLQLPSTPFSAMDMATLFAQDRACAMEKLTQPGLIIVDRYTSSNVAYTAAQSRSPHKRLQVMQDVEDMEDGLGIPRPDLQILVNTPPAVASTRAKKRAADIPTRNLDRYEANQRLQRDVFDIYTFMALSQDNWFITDPTKDTTDNVSAIITRIQALPIRHRLERK